MPEIELPTKEIASRRGIWSKLRGFVVVCLLLELVLVLAVLFLFQFGFQAIAKASESLRHVFSVTYLPVWAGIVAISFAYYFSVRWIEQRRPAELQLRGAGLPMVLGIGLGTLMFSLTIGILALLSVFHVTGFNGSDVLAGAIAGAAFSAVFEEIIFRGIIFRLTEQSLGSWLALTISALIFGAVHLLNPHASLQGAAAIVLEAGIFLAAAYMTTRRLWFVIGAHFGWNFAEGGIFGAAVSGNQSQGLIKSTVNGPTYLSGGIFGVEASVVAIAICLGVALLLLRRAKAKGEFVRPFWRRGVG